MSSHTRHGRSGIAKRISASIGARAPAPATRLIDPEAASRFFLRRRCMAVYSLACKSPLVWAREAARILGMQPSEPASHLRRMAAAGLLHCERSHNRSLYCAPGLIFPEDFPDIIILKGPHSGFALHSAAGNPGITAGDMARAGGSGIGEKTALRCASALAECGFLLAVRDGRRIRFYPTNKLAELRTKYERRARAFLNYSLSSLYAASLKPAAEMVSRNRAIVTVTAGGKQLTFPLALSPV